MLPKNYVLINVIKDNVYINIIVYYTFYTFIFDSLLDSQFHTKILLLLPLSASSVSFVSKIKSPVNFILFNVCNSVVCRIST